MMNEPTNTQTADLAQRLRQLIEQAACDQARQAEKRVVQQLDRQLERALK